MINISDWLGFFYELEWFCNNQSDYTKRMLVRCLGVLHRVGSALFFNILSKKENFPS